MSSTIATGHVPDVVANYARQLRRKLLPQDQRAEPLIAALAGLVRETYPGTQVQFGSTGLTVPGQGAAGFPVSVEVVGNTLLLYVGPGIVELHSEDDIRSYLLRTCSPLSSLTVTGRGGKAMEWVLSEHAGTPQQTRLLTGGTGAGWSWLRLETRTYRNERQSPSARPA